MTTQKKNWNILITNDDGIHADGIKHLIGALSEVADVYVCAPDRERSASGHSITVRNPVVMEHMELSDAKVGMVFSGTPADCVKMGIRFLRMRGVDIDMVFSGINHGGNLGTDTLYSGTVSAALEGVLCGVPGVAVSVDSHRPKHFDMACRLAVHMFDKVREGIPSGIALSVNVPNLPAEEVKGLKYARLGRREYVEEFEEKINEMGQTEYWYKGMPVVYDNVDLNNDVVAMQEKYATITPIKYDLTDERFLREIINWELEI